MILAEVVFLIQAEGFPLPDQLPGLRAAPERNTNERPVFLMHL
jgi:hypothetical protein